MSESYEEIFEGESVIRIAPNDRHELICNRLHLHLSSILINNVELSLLPARTILTLTPGTFVRPDLAIMSKKTNSLWLAAEIISSVDHRYDTVIKKEIYESTTLPKLWMIDPRYDNVEVYFGTEYGLALKYILAGSEVLEDIALPGLNMIIKDLFAS
ncbi:MAG: Uma2 family endonuclease [Verrucomicrobia bacterium]|nr:Uma2 family endonuclease [Verrucomicrobiota bacterium]